MTDSISYMNEGKCSICPRGCAEEREKAAGFCSYPCTAYIAKVMRHRWEEPCISGSLGSGAIFFSGCNLGCVFCQNYQISHGHGNSDIFYGKSFDSEKLSDLFLRMQEKNVENINLVTPTHFTPLIRKALELSKKKLKIPVVWNSNCYENAEILKTLDGLIDIYLPDLKYYSPKISAKYSFAPDYFEKASSALLEMFRQRSKTCFDGIIMKSGVIVRHLIMPGHTLDSIKIFDYLEKNYGNKIYISLMSQFIPVGRSCDFPEINRKIFRKEYKRVMDHVSMLGFINGFYQDMGSAAGNFIPDFDDFGSL